MALAGVCFNYDKLKFAAVGFSASQYERKREFYGRKAFSFLS